MDIYKNMIFELAENQTNKRFFNTDSDHAVVVHQAIAMYAQDNINIFSGSLCSQISNNKKYCELIDKFLKSSPIHKINIILTDYNDEFLKTHIYEVLSKYESQVNIKKMEGKVLKDGFPVHFTFSDGRMFRLETDIVKHMAYGNFNSPSEVKVLNDIFKLASDKAEPLVAC